MANTEWTVGQTVIVRDVNDRGRGPQTGTIVKVGRKLVTVQTVWTVGSHELTSDAVFRIDTGRENDNYGHRWITSEQAYADETRRVDVVAALKDRGLPITYECKLDVDTLAAILDVLDARAAQ